MITAVSMPQILAIPNAKLNARAKVLYLVIKELCGEEDSTLANQEQLQEATGLPEKTVQRAFRDLARHRLVRRHRDHSLPFGPWRTWLVTPKRNGK